LGYDVLVKYPVMSRESFVQYPIWKSQHKTLKHLFEMCLLSKCTFNSWVQTSNLNFGHFASIFLFWYSGRDMLLLYSRILVTQILEQICR